MRPPHEAGEVQGQFPLGQGVVRPSMRPPHEAGEVATEQASRNALRRPSMRPPHEAGEVQTSGKGKTIICMSFNEAPARGGGGQASPGCGGVPVESLQ